MVNKLLAVFLWCFSMIHFAGCEVRNQQSEVNGSSPVTEVSKSNTRKKDERILTNVDELCGRLADIKKLPSRDPSDSDPIYEAIISRGSEAAPCLVEEITNEQPMPDPREAPSWEHYKVGDTAVFLLVDIAKNDELLEAMLPSEYRKRWKTDGIYAYFDYVSETKNRQNLQKWWRAWVNKNIAK